MPAWYGAIRGKVFPSYDLGEEFEPLEVLPPTPQSFVLRRSDTLETLGLVPSDYRAWAKKRGVIHVDPSFPSILYLPENARFSLRDQKIRWEDPDGAAREIGLTPDFAYLLPSGYKVEMKAESGGPWKLVGTVGEGFLCHKPCTVSGGGKSEISKPLTDAIVSGPVFIADWEKDMALAREVIERDYSDRFLDPDKQDLRKRSVLSTNRSLGSLIKLLTPSESLYTKEYNEWLESIPQRVKDLVLIIKRRHRPDWGDDWEKSFSVDSVNGQPPTSSASRAPSSSPAISASVSTRTVPGVCSPSARISFPPLRSWRRTTLPPLPWLISLLGDIGPGTFEQSAKFVHNCEYRLFQRPDDAIHRGFDKQTEKDLSRPGNFISNFQPLAREEAIGQVNRTLDFEKYTPPMQKLIRRVAKKGEEGDYFVSSANPRIVDGKVTKNPATCRPDPISSIPDPCIYQPWERDYGEDSGGKRACSTPSGRSSQGAATTRPIRKPVFVPSAASPPFTTSNCPSSSWTLSSRSRASRPPQPVPVPKVP